MFSFFSLFLFVREELGSGKFYTSSYFLHCDRVEFLRCSDGSRTREGSGHWINTRLGRKCIAGLFGVSINYGLLITVCSLPFMLIDCPGLANSPWYRLVLGFLVMFLESNLLCSSVFQFDYFILLILFCLILFVFFVFYSIISSKVQLVVRVGVLFLRERLQQ